MNSDCKIVFLSTLIPENIQNDVQKKIKSGMPDAACALQWHILEGLYANYQKEISLVNVLPISSFPNYYQDACIRDQEFITEYSKKNVNVGFFNFKGFRRISIENQVYRALSKMFEKSDYGLLFVYTLSTSFVAAVARLKKEKPNIRICAIVADLPNMNDLSSKKSVLNFLSNKVLSDNSYKHINKIDAFVLLTKQMAKYLQIRQPYCVVEGISTDTNNEGYLGQKEDDDIKRILYTGTLHKKFGIVNLIKAFESIDDEKYRLIICGTGDSESYVLQEAKSNKRIIFHGKVDRKKVLELQAEATVLVNPRQNEGEYTKYSFPSKNIEYLSSGKPVIAYKLDGIPDEYDDYLQYVDDNSIEALADKIVSICTLPKDELKTIGELGKRYVTSQKNPQKQCEKIKNMMEIVIQK